MVYCDVLACLQNMNVFIGFQTPGVLGLSRMRGEVPQRGREN